MKKNTKNRISCVFISVPKSLTGGYENVSGLDEKISAASRKKGIVKRLDDP